MVIQDVFPVKKIPDDIKNDLIVLYNTKYDGSNCKHFTELIASHEEIHVSETFVRSLLHKNNIYPPRTWKRLL